MRCIPDVLSTGTLRDERLVVGPGTLQGGVSAGHLAFQAIPAYIFRHLIDLPARSLPEKHFNDIAGTLKGFNVTSKKWANPSGTNILKIHVYAFLQ